MNEITANRKAHDERSEGEISSNMGKLKEWENIMAEVTKNCLLGPCSYLFHPITDFRCAADFDLLAAIFRSKCVIGLKC